MGTVGAAVERATRLDPVAHNPAAAMGAHRRQRMNRALEAVEDVGLTSDDHIHGLVVLIAADLADTHQSTSTKGFERRGLNRSPAVQT